MPLILGSLLVTFGAILVSVPVSIASAFYISEVAPAKLKEILKTGDRDAGYPLGSLGGLSGMTTLVPWVKNIFHLPTGLTALSGSIMLGLMAMPTIISISEDAINAVPKAYKEGL